MKIGRLFVAVVVLGIVVNFVGCAGSKKNVKNQQQQVTAEEIEKLKSELAQKDQQIDSLQQQLQNSQVREVSYSDDYDRPVCVKKTDKNIQIGLKNAGFYDGAIDGKIGSKTKQAIVSFQKKNDLKADGVVGKRTWSKLSKYVD